MTSDTAKAQAERLEKVAGEVTRVLRERDEERRKHSTLGDAEWSGMQILGHLVEMVPFWLAQAESLIFAPEPPLFGRTLESPERLAGPEQGASGDLEQLLSQWNANVGKASLRIRNMTAQERDKKGIHIRRGEMTAGDIIESFIVGHAEEHLEQIKAG